MKVVINSCFGGFGLSEEAIDMYRIESGISDISEYDISRFDPILINIIERIGIERAGGDFSKLEIVDIPKGTEFIIDEYDGMESIQYKNDIDWIVAT